MVDMKTMLFNGVLAFLTTLGTAFMGVAIALPEEIGLDGISGLQWSIMIVGSFVTFMTQRNGFKSRPPEKQ